jgi:uncharacterized OsmC-like protein
MNTIMAIGEYLGELRTEVKHARSGQTIITDAPIDNLGKGQAFSPTDLVCAALSSCMMTIMGQVADREGVDLKGLKAGIVKVMDNNPRKIAEIIITFSHPSLIATNPQKQKLINAARTCPVALSLDAELKQTVIFNF